MTVEAVLDHCPYEIESAQFHELLPSTHFIDPDEIKSTSLNLAIRQFHDIEKPAQTSGPTVMI